MLYDTDALAERYKVRVDTRIEPTYNAAPTNFMPVITLEGFELMRWGLIPRWAKDEKIGYRMINTRAESVFDKPVWKSVTMRCRCLVPANGFYEWQPLSSGKQPYYVHPKGVPIFSFAGLCETWQHDGAQWHTYSIITTEANKEMRPIHDRMPVILQSDDEARWLHADRREDIEPLLHPYHDGGLDLYRVSTAVNTVGTNDKSLIEQLNSR